MMKGLCGYSSSDDVAANTCAGRARPSCNIDALRERVAGQAELARRGVHAGLAGMPRRQGPQRLRDRRAALRRDSRRGRRSASSEYVVLAALRRKLLFWADVTERSVV